MAMRCAQFCLIAFAVPALHGQPMFEGASRFGDEELKGRPKIVSVERETLSEQPVRLPEEESAYREDGKLSSSKRFVDGKLVANELFEYDAEGRRRTITSRDAEDKVIRMQTFRRLPDETEEEVDTAGGKQMSRTIRRFDANQRVIELKSIDTGNVSTIMQFDFDDRGRPLEARVRLEDRDEMRVAIIYPGDPGENHAIVTVYDGAGAILAQVETMEDAVGNQMTRMLFGQDAHGKPANSARVAHMDAQGNWTLKTLLERNPRTQVDEPIARLDRSIVYY
jgi:hypothetical protein